MYDETMDLKEDYDISLAAINNYKKILRVNKYAVNAQHGNIKGGSACYRTFEKETAACKAIEKKWGTKIIHYNIDCGKATRESAYLNGVVNIPIKGV